MNKTHMNRCKYLLAALLDACAGGLLVAVSIRAVPKIMSAIIAEMMDKMRSEGAARSGHCIG